ncbi:MAG: recombinase family protein [Solobacterium sp.]|nr:recombinase family protein [Solobacterium sp.]
MNKDVIVFPATEVAAMHKKDTRNEKLRVAAYCRVSTDHEEQLGSCQNQIDYYRNYIDSNPNYINAGIYVDEGISGTTASKRKAFMSMIEDCRNGKIDLILTKSISRFARNTQDCLRYSRMLKDLDIGVLFEKENILTTDTSGELLFTILSSLAQEESRNISENTKWGIRSNFKKGIPHINANVLLGYEKDEDGNLIIHEDQALIVKFIYEQFMKGYTFHAIAKQLNKANVNGIYGKPRWCSSTIQRILSNEKYKGDVLMQKTYSKDFITKRPVLNTGQLPQYLLVQNHEPIIDPEFWELVQMEIIRRKHFSSIHGTRQCSGGSDCVLTGKVFCGICGRPLRRSFSNNTEEGYFYWKCSSNECSFHIKEDHLWNLIQIAMNEYLISLPFHELRWYLKEQYGAPLEQFHACLITSIIHCSPLLSLNEFFRSAVQEVKVWKDAVEIFLLA